MTDAEQNPNADKALEDRFRRLLRAYPAWYRKQRGEEMLTTLMDASQGRDRPTVGQRFDVVFGGLRKHLSVGSVPGKAVGVMVALFVATLGAIAGAVAGWHTAVDLPDDATADRIAQQAVPDMGSESYGDRSLFYWKNMNGELMPTPFAITDDGDDHHAGKVAYDLEHKQDGFARFREAKERMAAAGWEIQSVRTDDVLAEFTATRDGLDLKVSTWEEASYPGSTTVSISRHTPTLVPVLTAAGLIVGGLAGWMLTGRLYLRASRWSPARHTIVSVLLTVSGLALFLPIAINLYFVGASLAMPQERVPVWLGYTFGEPAIVAMIGATLMAIAFLIGALPSTAKRVAEVAR